MLYVFCMCVCFWLNLRYITLALKLSFHLGFLPLPSHHSFLTLINSYYKSLHSVVVVVLVSQSCPALCDPMDYSPQGSPVHRILQARILEWVATPSSRGSSRPRDRNWVSCIAGRFLTVWATKRILYHLSHQGSHIIHAEKTIQWIVWFPSWK